MSSIVAPPGHAVLPDLEEADLVVAILSVDGLSLATTTHGDVAMVGALQTYYARVADALAPAGGTVVKVLGDGVLVTFPRAAARAAVAALRTAQEVTTAHWQAVEPRCRVAVRAGVGPVVRAALGPPGATRPDVYGATLNALWRLPAGAWVLTPALSAEVEP